MRIAKSANVYRCSDLSARRVTISRPERVQIASQIIHFMTDQVLLLGLFYTVEPILVNNRLTNVAASPVAYEAEAKDMFAVVRELRELDMDILAFYHSHPTSPPVPSKTDREKSYWSGVVYFIISLQDDTPRLEGWWITPDSATKASWAVAGDGPSNDTVASPAMPG